MRQANALADTESLTAVVGSRLPAAQEAQLAAILAHPDSADVSISRLESQIAEMRVDLHTQELSERLAKMNAANDRQVCFEQLPPALRCCCR